MRAQNVRMRAQNVHTNAQHVHYVCTKHRAEKREMTNAGTSNAGFTKSSQRKCKISQK